MDTLANTAHFWTLPLPVLYHNTEAPVADPIFAQLETILSEDEVARSRRFKFENNRREYLAAHALCRLMLSHFSGTSPKDWEFEAGPHGRPEIAGDNTDKLRFNISHTKGLVGVAVTQNHDIGVDVEWTDRKNQLDEIARAKFSEPEVAYYSDATDADKRRCFFKFWTLKESYIKAIGKGLAEPLDGFAFAFDPLRIDFLHGQDVSDSWQFRLLDVEKGHLGAVAVRSGNNPEVKINHQDIDIKDIIGMLPQA